MNGIKNIEQSLPMQSSFESSNLTYTIFKTKKKSFIQILGVLNSYQLVLIKQILQTFLKRIFRIWLF